MLQQSKNDDVLDLMDQYFATASKEEIAKDVEYVNNLGTNGISFEEYVEGLTHLNEDLHNLNQIIPVDPSIG